MRAKGPVVRHACSQATLKGEDACGGASHDGYSLFLIADGHNGSAAARHCAERVPLDVHAALPACAGGAPPHPDAMRGALAEAFRSTHASFVGAGHRQSGAVLSVCCVSGWSVTVAGVGDCLAVLDTGTEVVALTADHRLGSNYAEFQRLQAKGAVLAQVDEWGAGPAAPGANGYGPVRLWPGGVMISRAIGDADVGELLRHDPHIKQVVAPASGARLIIASDGLWDSVTTGRVVRHLRGSTDPEGASQAAVQLALRSNGGSARDDITVIVIDLLPEGCPDFRTACREAATAKKAADKAAPPPAPRTPQPGGGRSGGVARMLGGCFGAPPRVAADGEAAARRRSGSMDSERSVSDPSVHAARKATTVQFVADVDTLYQDAVTGTLCASLARLRGALPDDCGALLEDSAHGGSAHGGMSMAEALLRSSAEAGAMDRSQRALEQDISTRMPRGGGERPSPLLAVLGHTSREQPLTPVSGEAVAVRT